MDAIVTQAFKGVKDGEIYHTDFAVGESVSGELARLAVESGKAEYPRKATVGTEVEPMKQRGRPRKVDNDD